MKYRAKTLLELFLIFFKLSPITFGGGYSMISLIHKEVVDRKEWVGEKELLDIITITQSIPGAIAINMAMFVGYRVLGLLGAIVALLGIVFPTITLVVFISIFYLFFKENAIVRAAFDGIGSAVIALIIHAGYIISKSSLVDLFTWIIMVLSVITMIFFSINPIWLIMSGLLIGVNIIIFKRKKGMSLNVNNEK